MKRFLSIAFVVAALTAASTARAQTTTNPTHVFTTIDSTLRPVVSQLFLVGVLDGASGPTQVRLTGDTAHPEPLEACERAAMLLMSKPGQYRLEVWLSGGYISGTPFYSFSFCRLSRVNP